MLALSFPCLLLLDAGGVSDALPDGEKPEGGELFQLSKHQDGAPLCLWLWLPGLVVVISASVQPQGYGMHNM